MMIIPAIDLLDGHCVRLTKGRFDRVTVYGDDPAAVALSFAEHGAERLHVVDLDAAGGEGNNHDSIQDIRRAFPGILEVGGGIRSLDGARLLRDMGVDLLVVGSVLAREPERVREWLHTLGPVLVGGIDARDGVVKVGGWKESTSLYVLELARRAAELGLVEIIHTDIGRDGTLTGPNLREAALMAQVSGLPVIVSGGVGSETDLKEAEAAGMSGAIVGKALYEKKLDLGSLLRIFERKEK